MKIVNRFSGATIFESAHETMRKTVLAALESDADLSDADLSDAYLSDADLSGADLSGADLSGADLRGADLRGAYLSGADLRGADLRDADLSGADLSGANLRGADLSGAYLRGADLPKISGLENLRGAICARVCENPENLEMSDWHTCETTHCIAGWAVRIHPQGELLESIYGTSAAAAMIFQVCEGEVPDFHSSNEVAMEWLKKEKSDSE